MMRKYINRRIALIILAIVANSFFAVAQQEMTLEDCRLQALTFNKALKNSEYRKEEAVANQKLARTAYLPKVDAQSSITYVPGLDMVIPVSEEGMLLEDITYISTQLGLQLPVYAGGKIRHSNKMADIGVEIAEDAYELKYAEVIELTDQAYWNVVALEENAELAGKYVAMLTELEEQMNDMYELGLVPASEKLKVTVQKNEAELNRLKAKNGLRISRMALNQVLGLDLDIEINIADTLNSNTILPDFSGGLEQALGNRPELKILEGKLGVSTYNKKVVNSGYLPQVGVGVNYTHSYISNLLEDGNWNTMAAAKVSIPLIHWNEGKYKRKAANLRIKQAEEQLSNTRDLVTLEVNQVMIQLEEAHEAIIIAKKNIEESAESLEETQVSFEAGLNTTTDVLNAQAGWQKARAKLIGSLARFEVLKTTWQKATGSLMVID